MCGILRGIFLAGLDKALTCEVHITFVLAHICKNFWSVCTFYHYAYVAHICNVAPHICSMTSNMFSEIGVDLGHIHAYVHSCMHT